MARVPTISDFKVDPSSGGLPTVRPPSGEGFGYAAKQTQQLGQAIESTGSEMSNIVAREQDHANQLRVMEAENDARRAAIELTYDPNEGYTNIQGGDVMHRDSGKPLAVEYGEKYQEKLNDISSGLSNDAQRQAFQSTAMQLRTSFDAQATEHEAKEYRGYQLSIAKGAAELAGQEIALHPTDFDYINQRLPKLDFAITQVGQLNGLSANEITALQNTARSTAISGAINAAIDGEDITTASALFDKYGDKLLAPDKAKIEGPLRKEQEGRIVLGVGDLVAGAIPGTGVDRPAAEKVFQSLIAQESGGVPRPGVMTKWGQAQGVTQVLDVTGKGVAKKLGIEWRPDLMRGKSQEAIAYQTQIGRGYFNEGLQKYGGDFSKALMYYHGGPDESMWGPKTRQYAQEVMARAGAKGDTGSINVTLEDALSTGRAALLAQKPDASPSLIKAVDQEVTTRWTIRKNAIEQHADENVSAAQAALIANGGNYNALPAKVRRALPPDKVGSVVNFAEGLRNFNDQTDEATYATLATNPDKLKTMSDSEWLSYTTKLSRQDFKSFSALRGELRTGKKGSDPGSLNTEAINRVFNNRWSSLGLDPTPKPDDVHGLAQVGAARRFVDHAIGAEQQRLGKQMNDLEVQKFVDALFLKTSDKSGWFGSKTQVSRYTTKYEDINAKQRQEIEDSLRRRGVPVTEDNVLSVFYSM